MAVPARGEWLTTTEACEELGVYLRTLYRFIDEGSLPAYKLGRRIRVRRSDLVEFLAENRMKPGDITATHQYVEKAAYRRPPAGLREMQGRLDAFVAGYGSGEPAACPLCGEMVAPVDAARHLLRHR